MGDKLKRNRRVETGASGARRLSDLRQLQTRGIVPRELAASVAEEHPPIDGLAWTEHARKRFAERVAADLEPELLYDYLKGRRPMLVSHIVETRLAHKHEEFAPYGLKVPNVCRVVLAWKPHNPNSPDANRRGVWVVVTVLPW